jgi:hypothetical protein
MAALTQHLEERIKIKVYKHVELGVKIMQKDEDGVQRIVDDFHVWLPRMWSSNQPLVKMATVEFASP